MKLPPAFEAWCNSRGYTLARLPDPPVLPPLATELATVKTPAKPEPPLQPIPHDQWPLYALELEKRQQPGEKGVGDTAARLLEALGVKTLAEVYTKLTGQDCGCAGRQARLNTLYPYPASE